jgi:hypothetical protein
LRRGETLIADDFVQTTDDVSKIFASTTSAFLPIISVK